MNYTFEPLERYDPPLELMLDSYVSDKTQYKVKITGKGSSFIIMLFDQKPYKIFKHCQDEVIEKLSMLLAGEEIKVIQEMRKITIKEGNKFIKRKEDDKWYY